MHNAETEYELWEERARKEAAKGNRVLNIAICRECLGRIPLVNLAGDGTWPDIKACLCGDGITYQELDMAHFGMVCPDLLELSSTDLVRAD